MPNLDDIIASLPEIGDMICKALALFAVTYFVLAMLGAPAR